MYSSKSKKYASNNKPIYINPNIFLVKYKLEQHTPLTNAYSISTRIIQVYMKFSDQFRYT